MKKLFLCLLLTWPAAVFAQTTNVVYDPSGNAIPATDDYAFYWKGLFVGMGIYVVGLVVKMARRTASDF